MNKNMGLRIFNRAPINFWESVAVEEDAMTKNKDTICHKVKHNPAENGSDTYRKHMKPFTHGMPEQWLKLMEALNIVICGNGLNENGHVPFNLTCSSLKGEALCVFNDKAAEQEEEMKYTHINCLRAITEHIFSKDNPLQKQKLYMHNHVFLHLNNRQVSKFHARWNKINNWLNEFPPFKPNQHFPDDQIKDILYSIIAKCWQSYLQCEDKFDITTSSANDFIDIMQHYQLVYQLNPLLKQQNQLKNNKDDSKKSMEKSNNKTSEVGK